MTESQKKKKIRESNKALCEKYPFLTCYTDNEETTPTYDFTWQDDVEEGWVKAFCPQMWDELKAILEKYDYVNKLYFTCIKEKWGLLNIYYGGLPREIYDEVFEWSQKYEKLSEGVCKYCGKPSTRQTLGWITYVCDDCIEKMKTTVGVVNSIPKEDAEEFYKDPQEYWLNHVNP